MYMYMQTALLSKLTFELSYIYVLQYTITPQVSVELLHRIVEHFIRAGEQNLCTTLRYLHELEGSLALFSRTSFIRHTGG